jgi:hypothetical protein
MPAMPDCRSLNMGAHRNSGRSMLVPIGFSGHRASVEAMLTRGLPHSGMQPTQGPSATNTHLTRGVHRPWEFCHRFPPT